MKLSFCIRTNVLAKMADVTEAELVYALMTTGELFDSTGRVQGAYAPLFTKTPQNELTCLPITAT